jgi:DNA-binding MarR family transcriptional regulator
MSKSQETRRERRIGALLRLPHRAFVERLHAGLIAAGYTELRPPYMVVFQYMEPEGVRLTDLAEQAQITKQSMGYLVDYLEEHDYVERVPDPADGRARIVRPTAKGHAMTDMANQIARQIEAEWDRLLGGRMGQLREILSDLVIELEGESVAGRQNGRGG